MVPVSGYRMQSAATLEATSRVPVLVLTARRKMPHDCSPMPPECCESVERSFTADAAPPCSADPTGLIRAYLGRVYPSASWERASEEVVRDFFASRHVFYSAALWKAGEERCLDSAVGLAVQLSRRSKGFSFWRPLTGQN